jgi:hypothetical protein
MCCELGAVEGMTSGQAIEGAASITLGWLDLAWIPTELLLDLPQLPAPASFLAFEARGVSDPLAFRASDPVGLRDVRTSTEKKATRSEHSGHVHHIRRPLWAAGGTSWQKRTVGVPSSR